MICQEFEKIISELMRDPRAEDSAASAAMLSHAAACARCAERLAAEQALTMGLRALAMSDRESVAPARVEAALRQAFRARAADVSALESSSWRRARARRLPAVWAIAASLTLLVAGVSIIWLWQGSQQAEQSTRATAQEAAPMPGATPAAASSQTQTAVGAPAMQRAEHTRFEVVTSSTRARNAVRRRARALPSHATVAATGSNARQAETAEMTPEVTTEYLPLVPGGGTSSLEGGQIVRVELPRSALGLFGLPVSAERADERVRADVVLGHDGVAQAIRFVR